jgi:hypothetical protein
MSTSFVMRAILAATVLCVAPAVASAQAPQTKRCGDGTTSTRSYFACLGHGGVDTSHAVERPRGETPRHHAAEAVQAGEPRAKHAKSKAHAKARTSAKTSPKPSAHRARNARHPAPAPAPAPSAKNKREGERRGWLPWRHKNTKEQDAKKPKKHRKSSRLPVPERPNGQPR